MTPHQALVLFALFIITILQIIQTVYAVKRRPKKVVNSPKVVPSLLSENVGSKLTEDLMALRESRFSVPPRRQETIVTYKKGTDGFTKR